MHRKLIRIAALTISPLILFSLVSIHPVNAQVCNLPYCYGQPYGYQLEDFMLNGDPFFCIEKPPVNSKSILLNVAYSLKTWHHFLPNLNMHTVIGKKSANCNIFMYFIKSSNPILQGSNGLTQPDSHSGIARIYIPYDKQFGCPNPKTDFSMIKAIEHETGHALGLGHFVLHSQQEANLVIGGKELSPSIMVSSQCGGLSHASVTALDGMQVMKLRS